MRAQLYRWLVTTGLMGATLIVTPNVASAQPDVRDHRHGSVHEEGPPREAPPPPREERVAARAGFTWQPGRWDWRRGKWEWMSGHWEKERHGKKWRQARWEQQNGAYVLVDGDWVDDVVVRPTAAPPAPREEKFDPRPGFVYVRGRWDWRNGNWEWQPGRWEKERRGKHWREARWEQQNGAYVLVDGGWEDAALYPTAAPPAPREERWDARPGFVWVKGRWDWRNGEWTWLNGHFERQRARQMWTEGSWQMRDGHYVWVEGRWGAAPAWPPLSMAPPAPQPETPQARPGYFWEAGDWQWKNGQYVWGPGQLIPVRPGYHRLVGMWRQDGDHWVRSNNGWEKDAAPPPPPPPGPEIRDHRAPPPPVNGPTSAPPAPRAENTQPRAGFVFIRGHYEWRNNAYEWINGHWERQRANQRWTDGRWEARGNTWVWVDGSWQ
jgi:hypothetical protein